jgi:transposase
LNRLRRRLSLTLEIIRELDAVREQVVEAQHDSESRTVKALCTIRGIGVNFASVLTREVFYRTFDNRRLWLRYQPESSHAAWFRDRVGSLEGRIRRITIVALARKLLMAIWCLATLGLAPEGAIIAA